MLHAAYQHALAEIVHVGRNAHAAARFGKATVCRDQQGRAQFLSVAQMGAGEIALATHRLDPGIGMHADARLCRHGFPRGRTKEVIGNQRAQVIVAQGRAIDSEVRASAIHDACAADWRDLVFRDVLPDSKRAQQAHRGMRQRNLAAVEAGFGQRIGAQVRGQARVLQQPAGGRAHGGRGGKARCGGIAAGAGDQHG
mgnify:CR=1 FL=1